MKKVVLNVLDDSKFHLLIDFLEEIRFIQIESPRFKSNHFKKMNALPQSILHPRKVKTFTKFTRKELHAR